MLAIRNGKNPGRRAPAGTRAPGTNRELDKLLCCYESMNAEGRERLLEKAEIMAESGRFGRKLVRLSYIRRQRGI